MYNRNRTSNGLIVNRFRVWTLAFLVIFALASMPATALAAEGHSLMSEVKDLLEKYHISNVSGSELEEAAIEGMIESLDDPYAQYMTQEEWNNYQSAVEQHYVGIGVRLGEDEFGVYAAEVFPQSPAAEAGIKSGDYIIAVNGISAVGKRTQDIVNMIVGDEFTEVEVTILSGDERRTLQMTRRSVQIPIVKGEWLNGGYGYIKIETFSWEADEEFADQLAELEERGLSGLIIDLRDNPGGYVDTVSRIAGQFIEDGVLMHTRDKSGKNDPVAIMGRKTTAYPIAILVNEHSASGSEVFAGAMQDYGKAVVIGVQTFGKGSVQSILPLSNGGVLKMTIQEYLTPNGRRVNHIGIKPDIEVQGKLPQLLTALREVGMSDITLSSRRNGVMIQGVSFPHSLPYIEHEGRYYVHSRVLGALSGLSVSWNDDEKRITLQDGEIRLTYGIEEDAVMQQNGITYLDLDVFAQQVTSLTWSVVNGELTLRVQ